MGAEWWAVGAAWWVVVDMQAGLLPGRGRAGSFLSNAGSLATPMESTWATSATKANPTADLLPGTSGEADSAGDSR